VVLAELNAFGGNTDAAVSMPGPTEERFREAAKRHGIWLVPGSMFEASGGHIYNTTPVITPDGEVIARYRKQFPWLPYENAVTPGDQFCVFDVPGISRFGISTCYDMWFPETIRTMAWMGAEVIIHPSLTSTMDRDVETAMIRSHAAMNQCYFFDVNLAGPLGVGNGWQNLGQPLKSFRDCKIEFAPYLEGYASEPLQALGPISMAGDKHGEDVNK